MEVYESWRQSFANYRFRVGDLPLTTDVVVGSTVVGYVLTVKLLQHFMESRKPVQFTGVLRLFSIVHNWFLAALSLFMLVASLRELVTGFLVHGEEAMFCDQHNYISRGPLILWFYIFYLSKFYELLDTFILVLKKKPVIFLHIYHHFITLVLVYVMLRNEVIMQWTCITANCFVHVFMYSYYAAREHGWHKPCDFVRPWVTRVQIIQFIFDLGSVVYSLKWQLQTGWKCSGPPEAWGFGVFVVSSFLLLFINFYIIQYCRKTKVRSDCNGTHTNGTNGTNGKSGASPKRKLNKAE